jgi:hypothetical protein
MPGLVCLRRFPSHIVAEVARAALESHGIAATVSSPCGGWDITSSSGVAKLLVNEDSAQIAEEVLASMQELSDSSGIEAPKANRSDGRQMVIRIGVAVIIAAAVIGWLFRR